MFFQSASKMSGNERLKMSADRKLRCTAGHPGEPQAYLQTPVYVAETQERALAEAEEGLMRFATYRADLVRGPLSYAEVQREKGIIGTPDTVADRIAELRDEAQLAGISAEINPGSMLSHAQVMSSLRLWFA